MSIGIGDHVSWNTPQGRTHGTVVERRTEDFSLAGHDFTASQDEPMFVLESEKSGARAAHRPSALRTCRVDGATASRTSAVGGELSAASGATAPNGADKSEAIRHAVCSRADGDARERTRRRAAALGDLVPERSGKETHTGWGDHDRVPDEDYLRDVPPHHG